MGIPVNVLVNSVLWMTQMFAKVTGQHAYVSLMLNNRSICVQGDHEVENWASCNKTQICESLLKPKDRDYWLSAEFFIDSDQLSDANFNADCNTGPPSPAIDLEAENITCSSHLMICCLYEETTIRGTSDPTVTIECPHNFLADSCTSRCHLTYHECVDSDRIEKFTRDNPDRYFWTSSYITTLHNGNGLSMKDLNKTIITNERGCFDHCLNLNSSHEVHYISFNPSKTQNTCRCFSRDAVKDPVQFEGNIYEVRNKTCGYEMSVGCIAVIYHNSSVTYSLKNCSRQLAALCGPTPNPQEICSISAPTKKDIQPSRKQDSPAVTELTTNPDKVFGDGMSRESIKIIALVGSTLLFVGFLCVIVYIYSKRKKKRRKHVERARPNSLSNRTYNLHQNTNTDDDELYTSITETADLLPEIRRPLLPPRNNTTKDHIMQEMEYSTPSDAVAPTVDVYTDTYDNPLRKTTGNSGESVDTYSNTKDTVDLTRIGHTCVSPSSEYEIRAMKETNIDLLSTNDVINHECTIGAEGGYQIGGNVARDTSEFSHINNAYFTLIKPIEDTDIECKHDTNIAQSSNGDNTEYEDTSMNNGIVGIGKSNTGLRTEHDFDKIDTEEDSLLCKLSPYLLRELNIRIMPDDNEYAVNVARKSSSNVHLSNFDQHGRGDNWKAVENEDPESDYDRLGYVERIMKVKGKTKLYNHVVLGASKKESDKSLNRRGTI